LAANQFNQLKAHWYNNWAVNKAHSMKLKYAALGLLLISASLYFSSETEETPLVAFSKPPLAEKRQGSAIELYEIGDLLDAHQKLSDLAEKNHYTIVEIYTIHCGTCARLDKSFKAFLDQRKDVVVKKVKAFSGYIQFPTSNGLTMSQWNRRQDQIRDTYNFYGTPHIEIYGPYGRVIAVDKNKNKTGLNFLYSWLKDESV